MTAHTTVLLHEAVDALNIRADGVYVDGTFGRGGHSRLIVSRLGAHGRLIVFDKDPEAVAAARAWAQNEPRLSVVHDGFSTLSTALDGLGVDKVHGILCDLGVSSPQLDDASRGFSFRFDAPLDMRMDTTRGQSAAQWLAEADEQQLYEVIRDYGEERFARQIARAVVAARQGGNPIDTTGKLAQIAAQCVRTRERGQHPATRTFQAVRIFINRELAEINALLPQAAARLHTGGRLAVIAFHSLEDRIVKQFFKAQSTPPALPKWVLLPDSALPEMPLKTIGKAVKPAAAETAANARARSAVLRVAERTAAPFPPETKVPDK